MSMTGRTGQGGAAGAPDPLAESTSSGSSSGAGSSGEGSSGSATSSGPNWKWVFGAAIAVVTIYVVLMFLAFARADENLPENSWSRSVYVLLGFEAIAFTAVGWLFGREVHRGEAQVAKQQAVEAKQDAARADSEFKDERAKADGAKDAVTTARERAITAEVKGQTLADAIRASRGGSGEPTGGDERSGDRGAPQPGSAPMDPLRDLADRLFPSE